MEYEGIGCPEIKFLNKPIEQSRLWLIAKENHLVQSPHSMIGKTREKIKHLSNQNNGAIFFILSKQIHEMCGERIIDSNRKGKRKHDNRKLSKTNLSDIRAAAEQDCLDGYFSVVVEILIELIFKHKIEKRQEDCTEYCKLLMDVLMSSQEYELGKICFENFISHMGPSDYSKNLHLYIKTITLKSELSAFGQLINLQRLEVFEKNNRNKELFFLIINQKAFCYAILGDWEKALDEELNVLSEVNNVFSQYICQLNISRLLLCLQRPSKSIVTLVSAFATLANLINKDNYETLIMLYLSKAGKKLGIKQSFLYRKDLTGLTSNWRIAQAIDQFSIHSNYCQVDHFEKQFLSIELTSFQNVIIEVYKGDQNQPQLNEIYQVLNHDQGIKIGPYWIILKNSTEKLQLHIRNDF